MLMPKTSPSIRYAYTGVNLFEIPFPFFRESSIQVVAELSNLRAPETLFLEPGIDYTVVGRPAEYGDSPIAFLSGELTLTSKGAEKAKTRDWIAIIRSTEQSQLFKYSELDPFPAKSHENALSKNTAMIQELQEEVNRSIKVPFTSEKAPADLLDEFFQSAEDASTFAAIAKAEATRAETASNAAQTSQAITTVLHNETQGFRDETKILHDKTAVLATQVTTDIAGVADAIQAEGAAQVAIVQTEGTTQVARVAAVLPEPEVAHIGIPLALVPQADGAFIWQEVGSGVPIGSEMLFPGTIPPAGWLDESRYHGLLPRAAYPDLWAFALASGNLLDDASWQAQVTAQGSCGAFSTGDGAATFRIPLLRRVFPRARDIDGGLDVGMWQGDATQRITGIMSHFVGAGTGYEGSGAFGLDTSQVIGRVYSPVGSTGYAVTFDSSNVVPTADENRPVSIVRLPIIKAWDAAVVPADLEVAGLVNQISAVSDRVNSPAHIRELAGNRVWISAEYEPVIGKETSIPHGLTLDPLKSFADVLLMCVIPELGYSAGDFAQWSTYPEVYSASGGSMCRLSSTNVAITTGGASTGLGVVHKTTGRASPAPILANWRYIFRIWY